MVNYFKKIAVLTIGNTPMEISRENSLSWQLPEYHFDSTDDLPEEFPDTTKVSTVDPLHAPKSKEKLSSGPVSGPPLANHTRNLKMKKRRRSSSYSAKAARKSRLKKKLNEQKLRENVMTLLKEQQLLKQKIELLKVEIVLSIKQRNQSSAIGEASPGVAENKWLKEELIRHRRYVATFREFLSSIQIESLNSQALRLKTHATKNAIQNIIGLCFSSMNSASWKLVEPQAIALKGPLGSCTFRHRCMLDEFFNYRQDVLGIQAPLKLSVRFADELMRPRNVSQLDNCLWPLNHALAALTQIDKANDGCTANYLAIRSLKTEVPIPLSSFPMNLVEKTSQLRDEPLTCKIIGQAFFSEKAVNVDDDFESVVPALLSGIILWRGSCDTTNATCIHRLVPWKSLRRKIEASTLADGDFLDESRFARLMMQESDRGFSRVLDTLTSSNFDS